MSRKQICRWEGLVWDWDDHIRNMSPLWCHKDQKKTAWNKELRAIWSLELLPHRKNVYRSYKSIFYLQLMIQFYLFILIWWLHLDGPQNKTVKKNKISCSWCFSGKREVSHYTQTHGAGSVVICECVSLCQPSRYCENKEQHSLSHTQTHTQTGSYPLSSHWSMAVSESTLSSSQTASGKKMRVKDWTKRWSRTWSSALVSSCTQRRRLFQTAPECNTACSITEDRSRMGAAHLRF